VVDKVVPVGWSERQAWLAARYCGEFGSRFPGVNAPVAVGSGKLITPWDRMHVAYATGLRSPEVGAVRDRDADVELEDR
jgi:hypothetical protein